jgi:nicotinamide riboside kinase
MSIKIAISGTHGVGKTTLAKRLAESLYVPLLSEVARDVAVSTGIEHTEQISKGSMLTRIMFQGAVFGMQGLKEKMHGGFVSDRSILDCIAYCHLYCLPEHFISTLEEAALIHTGGYDLIIYCPIPGCHVQDDGFRLTDKISQQKVDIYIQELIRDARCPVLRLGGERDIWFEDAMKRIKMDAEQKL